jgi:hypothetical protein
MGSFSIVPILIFFVPLSCVLLLVYHTQIKGMVYIYRLKKKVKAGSRWMHSKDFLHLAGKMDKSKRNPFKIYKSDRDYVIDSINQVVIVNGVKDGWVDLTYDQRHCWKNLDYGDYLWQFTIDDFLRKYVNVDEIVVDNKISIQLEYYHSGFNKEK